MSCVLFLNQCLPKPAVDKRLCNCHENCQHGDQTKFFRKKQPGQDNGDDKLDPLLANAFEKAPKKGVQCFVF